MLTATHQNDLSEYKAMAAFHLFVARGPRPYVFPVFLCLLGVAVLALGIIFQNAALYIGAAVLIAFSVAMPFLMLWIQNARIEKRVSNTPNYLDSTQIYAFTEDGFKLTVRCRDQEAESEFAWKDVVRIYERNDCFYLYLSGTQALILPKQCIEGGTADDLAVLFRRLGKQFKEKKDLRGVVVPSDQG